MQFNNFKHRIMSAKIYCENIWDLKKITQHVT